MSILAGITAELGFLRSEAEALMLDYGSASRPSGGFVYDAGTDSDVEATDPLFSSACKIQNRALVARESEVGERTSVSVRTELHLPVSTAPLTAGDLYTVTLPHALSTVAADSVFRVTAPIGKTLATARRYEVESVVR